MQMVLGIPDTRAARDAEAIEGLLPGYLKLHKRNTDGGRSRYHIFAIQAFALSVPSQIVAQELPPDDAVKQDVGQASSHFTNVMRIFAGAVYQPIFEEFLVKDQLRFVKPNAIILSFQFHELGHATMRLSPKEIRALKTLLRDKKTGFYYVAYELDADLAVFRDLAKIRARWSDEKRRQVYVRFLNQPL